MAISRKYGKDRVRFVGGPYAGKQFVQSAGVSTFTFFAKGMYGYYNPKGLWHKEELPHELLKFSLPERGFVPFKGAHLN